MAGVGRNHIVTIIYNTTVACLGIFKGVEYKIDLVSFASYYVLGGGEVWG